MTKAIESTVKILESLSEPTQEHLVEEFRRLALDAQDEAEGDSHFSRNKALKTAARKARLEIAEGKASPMDFEQL